MKRVGIVANDYKIGKFETELSKNGFNNYQIIDNTPGTKLIRINVEDNQVNEVYKICQLVELAIHRNN